MTPRQKQIHENIRLFEIERAERMKSLLWRIRVTWYKFTKWIL
jgi:hypothetical protein